MVNEQTNTVKLMFLFRKNNSQIHILFQKAYKNPIGTGFRELQSRNRDCL